MSIRTLILIAYAVDQLLLLPYAIHAVVTKVGLQPRWLAWVPVATTTFVPRLADASPFAWFLQFVPLVNIYVWWDWWSEFADSHGHRHPNLWAIGLLVPVVGSLMVIQFARHMPTGSTATA